MSIGSGIFPEFSFLGSIAPSPGGQANSSKRGGPAKASLLALLTRCSLSVDLLLFF